MVRTGLPCAVVPERLANSQPDSQPPLVRTLAIAGAESSHCKGVATAACMRLRSGLLGCGGGMYCLVTAS